ncbi:MAG: LemA family protein [Lachnospiraceae bacterium]|nr:LemA family protein [Lachnospiraceae bacterium]
MSGLFSVLGIIAVIIAVLLVLFLVWMISTSNSFARKTVKIDESLSGIEVALTKRYDTLTKMRDVAKSYAKHELDTLTTVISMRRGMSVKELTDSANQMNEMASSINVVAEAYPELRSNTVFEELQKGIRDTEEQLQAARRLYNANVSSYNQQLVTFPASIIGRMRGFAKRDFFEAEEYKMQDVKMDL